MSTQAINPLLPVGFNYYGNAAISDTLGLDTLGINPMMNPMMGMYGSIMPGMGFGGYDYSQYFDTAKNWLNFQNDYGLLAVQNQRNFQIKSGAPESAVAGAITNLQMKITGNEQEQIIGAVENLKNALRMKYPNASEEEINAYVRAEYQNATGTTLLGDIKGYGSTSFGQGLKQGLGFGLFADRYTADENIAKITGQPVSRTDNMQKIAGKYVGSASTGAIIGGIAGGFFGAPWIGAAIGGGIGAAITGIKRYVTGK